MTTSLELEARLDNLLFTAQTEMADVDLFAPIQISEREECPICFIPFGFGMEDVLFFACCGKNVCCGCTYRNIQVVNERGTREYKQNCAFCRQPTQEEGSYIKQVKRLTKKNHPVALMVMAVRYLSGDRVIQSDTKTFEMLICAAELGHAPAFGMIAHLYEEDNTVFAQNISKTLAFGEIGAKKGDVKAHIIIASQRFEAGDYDNSIKHLKVAANAGHQGARIC